MASFCDLVCVCACLKACVWFVCDFCLCGVQWFNVVWFVWLSVRLPVLLCMCLRVLFATYGVVLYGVFVVWVCVWCMIYCDVAWSVWCCVLFVCVCVCCCVRCVCCL